MFFNNSLSEAFFPECFKTAKFIPIYKSGDSNSTVKYRPISMLPFFSKIFEKFMWARLDSYLKSNNILCTNQFGFRKTSNTTDAITEFLDYVYSSSDSKQSTIAVYPDFSKAFHIVNHNILMSKLVHNGVRGVRQLWFESHLSNMKQYVSIKSCSSSLSNITLGILQGLVLGRVLFLLYINDMNRSSNQMRFVHFAAWYNSFCIRQWHYNIENW